MSTTSTILENAKSWLSDFFDPGVRKEIKDLLENDPDELKDRFYKTLEFGTGGMRGIMGTGTNRINKYTLGKSTQGLSTYLKKVYGPDAINPTDIGCYTLGALPPFQAINSCVDMGASITMAKGAAGAGHGVTVRGELAQLEPFAPSAVSCCPAAGACPETQLRRRASRGVDISQG